MAVPAFEAALDALSHVELEAVLVTDHDGVVLLRAGEGAEDASIQRMAASYAQTTEHVSSKMQLGKNKLVAAMYENAVVVHASCPPLVLTLKAAAGSNLGLMMDAAPQAVAALQPLCRSAEAVSTTS
ncbi:hypothetical protein AB1Y20_008511 [Prymnesium parvum]|uniref:Late endosomal/lysosomal adaptor and MAPK and MTOR activator 5 n=1 Tax=Prymnesium parvum TaxID=97485 RepID=A0AB34ITR2_PRYPA